MAEAAALPVSVETAARLLDLLELHPGGLLVVDGASGGVGTGLVQLAVARGLTVVGTASEANHDYLRELGAIPTTYGTGLADRVHALVDQPVAGRSTWPARAAYPTWWRSPETRAGWPPSPTTARRRRA